MALLCLLGLFWLPSLSAQERDPVAVLYVYPSDASEIAVYSREALQAHFDGPIADFWTEQSYGRYDPEVTVFTWRMPIDTATAVPANGALPISMMNNTLPNGGDIVIPGYNPDDYSKTHILLGGGVIGFGGGFGVYTIKVNGEIHELVRLGSFTYLHPQDQFYSPWLRFEYYEAGAEYRGSFNGEESAYPALALTGADRTLLHEWGHGLGLSTHANYWRSEIEPIYGELYWWRRKEILWDQFGDYGNAFDIMGRSIGYALHINAFYKDLLGWFGADEKQVITETTRDIRLMPLQSQQPGRVRAVQYPIPAGVFTRPEPFDSSLDYAIYVEYRRGMGLDTHLNHPYLASNTEGLMINLARQRDGIFVAGWLLDMSPDGIVHDPSPALINDGTFRDQSDTHEATLNRGRTFYDRQMGVTITDVRPDGDAGIYLDFEVGAKAPELESGIYTTVLFNGETVQRSDAPELHSPSLDFRLDLTLDGRLTVTDLASGIIVWDSLWLAIPLAPAADEIALVDGELQLRSGGIVLWGSGAAGTAGASLSFTDLGGLQIVDEDSQVIWPEMQFMPAANLMVDVRRTEPPRASLAAAVASGATEVTYEIDIANIGTAGATGLRTSIVAPVGLTNIEVTCSAGADCSSMGTNVFEAGMDLPIAQTQSVTVSGQLDLPAEHLRLFVEASAPPGVSVFETGDDSVFIEETFNTEYVSRSGFER